MLRILWIVVCLCPLSLWAANENHTAIRKGVQDDVARDRILNFNRDIETALRPFYTGVIAEKTIPGPQGPNTVSPLEHELAFFLDRLTVCYKDFGPPHSIEPEPKRKDFTPSEIVALFQQAPTYTERRRWSHYFTSNRLVHFTVLMEALKEAKKDRALGEARARLSEILRPYIDLQNCVSAAEIEYTESLSKELNFLALRCERP